MILLSRTKGRHSFYLQGFCNLYLANVENMVSS